MRPARNRKWNYQRSKPRKLITAVRSRVKQQGVITQWLTMNLRDRLSKRWKC